MVEPATAYKGKTRKSKWSETVLSERTILLRLSRDFADRRLEKMEAEGASLERLIQHLDRGHAILVARKSADKERAASDTGKETSKPWYFARI
jgi:hypothetical protein